MSGALGRYAFPDEASVVYDGGHESPLDKTRSAPDGDEYSPAHLGVSSTEITALVRGAPVSGSGLEGGQITGPNSACTACRSRHLQRMVELSFGTLLFIFRSWMFVCGS